MNDFILLQNYARNLLLRYFLGCAGVLDAEPGFKGSLEVFTKNWRGKVKVVGREHSGRALLVDPRWKGEGARMLAVYLWDCGMVWLIDAPKLWAFMKRDGKLLDERYGKTVVPWAMVKRQLGGELVDLRCVPYLEFDLYRDLHIE
jgi:hypothetical protein